MGTQQIVPTAPRAQLELPTYHAGRARRSSEPIADIDVRVEVRRRGSPGGDVVLQVKCVRVGADGLGADIDARAARARPDVRRSDARRCGRGGDAGFCDETHAYTSPTLHVFAPTDFEVTCAIAISTLSELTDIILDCAHPPGREETSRFACTRARGCSARSIAAERRHVASDRALFVQRGAGSAVDPWCRLDTRRVAPTPRSAPARQTAGSSPRTHRRASPRRGPARRRRTRSMRRPR